MSTERCVLFPELRGIVDAIANSIASHPLHPAATHLPIALLLLTYSLDTLTILPPSVLGTLSSLPVLGPVASDLNGSIPLVAHHLLTLAVLSAVPAVITGVVELNKMIARYDLSGKMSKSSNKLEVLKKLPERLKMAFLHAMVMDAVILTSVWSLVGRKKSNAYILEGNMAFLSAALTVFLFGGASLGGQLVFHHAVGVKRTTSKSE